MLHVPSKRYNRVLRREKPAFHELTLLVLDLAYWHLVLLAKRRVDDSLMAEVLQ